MSEVKRTSLMNNLYPSVVSGIVLGVIGAVVSGALVNALVQDNQDAMIVAAYLGWALFFFIGIGAFNGVVKWGFARKARRPKRNCTWPAISRDSGATSAIRPIIRSSACNTW